MHALTSEMYGGQKKKKIGQNLHHKTYVSIQKCKSVLCTHPM